MLSISALIPYRKAAWITIQRSLSTTRPFVGSKDKDKQKHVNVKPGGSETRRKTQRQHQQERPSPHATNLGEKGETTPSKIYSQFKQPAAPPTKMGHQHSQDKEQTKNKRSNSSSKRTKAKQQHQDVFVTPGAPVTTPFYYNHNNTGLSSGSGTFRMTRVLSTLNASALFANGDKHRKRNRNTRESLLTVLREQVLMRRHRNAYALAGHGVPVQVLQDHINMADTLLAREEHAAECSFNNFHGDLNFDWYVYASTLCSRRVRLIACTMHFVTSVLLTSILPPLFQDARPRSRWDKPSLAVAQQGIVREFDIEHGTLSDRHESIGNHAGHGLDV
jgi:hypothetical protein